MTDKKMNPIDANQGEIIIYQSESGDTKIDVRFVDETVWLTQQQMAELFQSSRTNIVEHIQHIYEEGELDESSTCRKFRQVRTEGSRQVSREIPYYNLDMIISRISCEIYDCDSFSPMGNRTAKRIYGQRIYDRR